VQDTLANLAALDSLTFLSLQGVRTGSSLKAVGVLTALRRLAIARWAFATNPTALSRLTRLTALHLESMRELRLPTDLTSLQSLASFRLVDALARPSKSQLSLAWTGALTNLQSCEVSSADGAALHQQRSQCSVRQRRAAAASACAQACKDIGLALCLASCVLLACRCKGRSRLWV
jgi:hypothetical protein